MSIDQQKAKNCFVQQQLKNSGFFPHQSSLSQFMRMEKMALQIRARRMYSPYQLNAHTTVMNSYEVLGQPHKKPMDQPTLLRIQI